MDKQELEAIRARVEAATEGPWERVNTWIQTAAQKEGVAVLWGNDEQDFDNAANNAEFLSHARADVPTLLAEIERLTAENERLRGGGWVRTSERLPSYGMQCLIFAQEKINLAVFVHNAFDPRPYFELRHMSSLGQYTFITDEVSHWQPLPTKPEVTE